LFNKTTKSRLLLEIIDYYGLRPYLWSSLIYDKSKGNDFEKIEKILILSFEAQNQGINGF